MQVKAFVELTVAKSVREGLHHLIRLSGMGAMKPNTVVFGFYDDKLPLDYFTRQVFLKHILNFYRKLSVVNKCFIYRLDSAYKTTSFQGITANDEKFPLRLPNEKQLSPSEFVLMICDVILMHKNVCICRHFDLYNKADILKYVDSIVDFIICIMMR